MSFRSKKMSAFAVFKGRKTASFSNVGKATDAESPDISPKGKRSKSASTTPTNSRETSLSSIVSKFGTSDKKRQKAEAKKLKKMLKSASKNRPSYLPDSAIQSPLTELNTGSVQLKSLRPKGSMANLRYQLPLKADPGISVPNTPVTSSPMSVKRPAPDDREATPPQSDGDYEATPPLPPRNTRQKNKPRKSETPPLPPRPAIKRASRRGEKRQEQKTQERQSTRSSASDETDLAPPRPSKRRRISGENIRTSPQRTSSHLNKRPPLISQEGTRERTEPLPTHPSEREGATPYMYDSVMEASRLFECLIHPVKPQKFFSELWEKKPLLVKRHMPNYNEGWFSTSELDKILRENRVMFSEHVDVVTYTDGKRETHNPVGRAHAPVVWDYYQNGCSVRLLNPHTYCRNVWKLLSILQEYFGCCTGANVYLTPAGTQGFAPHYDDIEAFILQLEGKKHWRLYSPRTEAENLPRFSSSNFKDDDIGEPILDVILEAGDLLYFPKGTIHQGRTMDDAHSMHITLSCQQLNSWGDLMEKLVPQALQIAMAEDLEFRKSLPRNYLHYMGVAFSDSESTERKDFLRKIEQLMRKMISHAPVDSSVDQMGRRYLHDSLPPVLTEAEKACSIYGNGEHWDDKEGGVRGAVEIEPDTEVKVIRKGVIRLVTEEDKVCIFYNLENTRLYHEVEPQYIEITPEMAPAVEMLLHAYPGFVKVDDFPMEQVQEKVELAASMYEKGMLITREPLEHLSESEEDEEDDEEDTPV